METDPRDNLAETANGPEPSDSEALEPFTAASVPPGLEDASPQEPPIAETLAAEPVAGEAGSPADGPSEADASPGGGDVPVPLPDETAPELEQQPELPPDDRPAIEEQTPPPPEHGEDYPTSLEEEPLAASGGGTVEAAPPEEAAALPETAGSAGTAPAGTEEFPAESGPNWMLVFVCGWSGLTALNEMWHLIGESGLSVKLAQDLSVVGYGVLGVGLLGMALDALEWGRTRRTPLSIGISIVAALMTLAGVICLVLSHDPGRRI